NVLSQGDDAAKVLTEVLFMMVSLFVGLRHYRRPFVGPAGQLFAKRMGENHMGDFVRESISQDDFQRTSQVHNLAGHFSFCEGKRSGPARPLWTDIHLNSAAVLPTW